MYGTETYSHPICVVCLCKNWNGKVCAWQPCWLRDNGIHHVRHEPEKFHPVEPSIELHTHNNKSIGLLRWELMTTNDDNNSSTENSAQHEMKHDKWAKLIFPLSASVSVTVCEPDDINWHSHNSAGPVPITSENLIIPFSNPLVWDEIYQDR